MAAALALGCAIGFAAGLGVAPGPAPEATNALGSAAAPPGERTSRRSSDSASRVVSPRGAHAADIADEWNQLQERVGFDAALRFRDDPDALVASVVDAMSRDELELTLATLTGRERAELERVGDLHRYAKSFARVAMSGLLTDAPEFESAEIEFATRIADVFEAGPPRTVFESSSSRMFGVFPLDPSRQGALVAKWYRVDSPELLMLEEVPVVARDGEGFVRFDRAEGWPEGDYRLEVYAPGEEFELIASGRYETRGTATPRRATFH